MVVILVDTAKLPSLIHEIAYFLLNVAAIVICNFLSTVAEKHYFNPIFEP